MGPKELKATHESIFCDVCRRSMLKGERIEPYLTADRDRRLVCELCRLRAESAGWIREAVADDQLPVQAGAPRPRRSSLFSRRRGGERTEREPRPSRRSAEAAEPPPFLDDVVEEEHEPDPEPATGELFDVESELEIAYEGEQPPDASYDWVDREAPAATDPGSIVEREAPEPTEPAGETEPVEPADAPREPTGGETRRGVREKLPKAPWRNPRHVRAIPTSPDGKVHAALEVFNESDHPRRIAGIIRSLGPPQVSAGASGNRPSEVRVTIAWELSWYQYAVDLSDAEDPVRVSGKGQEIADLDGPAREWNAHADSSGKLHPGLPDNLQS